jgi:hypothetical protein
VLRARPVPAGACPRTEPSPHRRPTTSGDRGGPDGNERLTALTGAVLLILFAAEGLTLLQLGRLLYWHYLLGFLQALEKQPETYLGYSLVFIHKVSFLASAWHR